MSAFQEPATFAALEKREWAKSDVAHSYAKVFSKAADMVVLLLSCGVCANSPDQLFRFIKKSRRSPDPPDRVASALRAHRDDLRSLPKPQID